MDSKEQRSKFAGTFMLVLIQLPSTGVRWGTAVSPLLQNLYTQLTAPIVKQCAFAQLLGFLCNTLVA